MFFPKKCEKVRSEVTREFNSSNGRKGRFVDNFIVLVICASDGSRLKYLTTWELNWGPVQEPSLLPNIYVF